MTFLRRPRKIWTGVLCRPASLCAFTAAAAIGLVGLDPGVAQAAEPSTYYVDCGATTSAGTLAEPFSTLAQASSVDLQPGDSVLFKRGTTCRGTFTPHGRWDEAAPMTFGPYGEGTARPVIDGDGAPDAIRIENLGGFRLTGLEVTNAKQKGTDAKARGVLVVGNNYGGVLKDVQVSQMYVHDVWGDDTKDGDGSGGITVAVLGTDKPSNFEDVVIEDNTVEHVDRTGITAVPSTWASRTEQGNYDPDHEFVANKGIVISGNTVKDTGGDGIVVQTGDGATVEHNYVDGFQERSAGYNAGIWVWNSDDTTFRFNEATGGKTHRDGMAFDVDQGSNDTLYEYNYSHDNEGGFFLLCNAEGSIKNAVIRYNISQNDSFRGVENCSGPVDSAHIYNNTIYIGPGVSQTVINENNAAARNITFENNIVAKEGAGSAGFSLQSGKVTLVSNHMFGVEVPASAKGGAVDPRLMDPGQATAISDMDGYRLHVSSPSLHAGSVVADNGGRDFFGNAVSASSAPSIGAYEGPGIDGLVPAPLDVPVPAVSNGSFESGLSGWATHAANTIDDATAPDGDKVVELAVDQQGAYATAEQVVSGLIPGMTYRIAGWARTEGGAAVVGLKGAAKIDLTVTDAEWTPVSAEFTASERTATVFCYRDTVGTSSCDDLRFLAGPASPPTVTADISVPASSSGWYTTKPTVALNEVAPDGEYRTWYQVVDPASRQSQSERDWTLYTGPFSLADGDHDVLARAEDRTGVRGGPVEVARVRVDTVAPTITADIDEASRTASIQAIDGTSGLATLEYSVDGGATFAPVDGPVSVGSSVALDVRATDTAGLVASGHWMLPAQVPTPAASSGPTVAVGGLPRTGFDGGGALVALALLAGGLAAWAGVRRRRA